MKKHTDGLPLNRYNNETSIQSFRTITLKDDFHIPAGRTASISIADFQNLVSQPSSGQNYILTRTFRKAGITSQTLTPQGASTMKTRAVPITSFVPLKKK